MWVVTVPDYTPPSLNQILGCGPGKRGKLKRECANFFAVYASLAGVPVASASGGVKRRVLFTFHGWPRGQFPDPDNMLKVPLDALRAAALIVDDSQAWCEWERPAFVRSGVRKTVIELFDLSPEDAHVLPAIRAEPAVLRPDVGA